VNGDDTDVHCPHAPPANRTRAWNPVAGWPPPCDHTNDQVTCWVPAFQVPDTDDGAFGGGTDVFVDPDADADCPPVPTATTSTSANAPVGSPDCVHWVDNPTDAHADHPPLLTRDRTWNADAGGPAPWLHDHCHVTDVVVTAIAVTPVGADGAGLGVVSDADVAGDSPPVPTATTSTSATTPGDVFCTHWRTPDPTDVDAHAPPACR
jgi:hypothetical protein